MNVSMNVSMNARLIIIGGLCSLFSLFASPIYADDIMDTLAMQWSDPLLDPLSTRPSVLDSGKMLPGDTANIPPCSSDLSNPSNAIVDSPLTLIEAIDLALCHNPQVHSAWAAIKIQAAALGEARATYLPTLTASTSRLNDSTRFPDSKQTPTSLNSNTVYGNLNWRLFDFGGRNANRHSANALLEAALSNHDAVLQKTLASVIAAYFEAQTAQASWQAKQKNEELARHTLETAQRREHNGAGSQTDTLQAATALAKGSLDKSRAEGAYHKAISALIYAIGIHTTQGEKHLILAEDIVDQTDSIRQELNAWLVQAQARHPAIVAARAQLVSAQEKVTAARSEGLPTLDLMGNFYQNGRPNQGLTADKTQETLVGITLNIPLFDGFLHTYKVRGAQAKVEQNEAELQDTERQVLMEITKAHAEAMAAFENLKASQILLDASQHALSTVQRKFDKGVVDTLDILNTQMALSNAQQERIQCLAEWRSAKLRLVANAGFLGRQAFNVSTYHRLLR